MLFLCEVELTNSIQCNACDSGMPFTSRSQSIQQKDVNSTLVQQHCRLHLKRTSHKTNLVNQFFVQILVVAKSKKILRINNTINIETDKRSFVYFTSKVLIAGLDKNIFCKRIPIAAL